MSPLSVIFCGQPNKSSRGISGNRRWGGNSWATSKLKPPRNATNASWKVEWRAAHVSTHDPSLVGQSWCPSRILGYFCPSLNDAGYLVTPGRPFWNKRWLTGRTVGSPRVAGYTCITFFNVSIRQTYVPISTHKSYTRVGTQSTRNCISSQDHIGIQVCTQPVLKPLLYVNSGQSLLMLWRVFMSIPRFLNLLARSVSGYLGQTVADVAIWSHKTGKFACCVIRGSDIRDQYYLWKHSIVTKKMNRYLDYILYKTMGTLEHSSWKNLSW